MDKLNILKSKAVSLTTEPGVYLMKNIKGIIIYIGKAKNLKNRVLSYFRNLENQAEKVRKMVEHVEDFDFIVTNSEFEALVLECSLIKQHKPKYNILLKDSKGYRYIKISNEEYPRISVCSKKEENGALYIGPYVNSFSVKSVVEEVNKIFMLPSCNIKFFGSIRKKRPCLNYYINQCMGFCFNKIPREEYLKIIDDAVKYIKNGDVNFIKYMKEEMKRAASVQNFERAIKIRDKIRAIEKVHQTQKVYLEENFSADVISFYVLEDDICFVVLKFRNGRIVDKEDFIFKDTFSNEKVKEEFLASYYYKMEYIPETIILDFEINIELYAEYLKSRAKHRVKVKVAKKGDIKNLADIARKNAKEILNSQHKDVVIKENKTLKQLQNMLNLKKLPTYIESYDISNIGDSDIVGGMVVFKDGVPFKKNYRRFKIKTLKSRDDYASLREVISRRIERYAEGKDDSFSKLPDVIFLDGGYNHVMAVRSLVEKENFNVPLFGLVKDDKHKTRAIVSASGEIAIKSLTDVFLLLCRIQNEVHRFTISYQRKSHKKNMLNLKISNIDGVGEKIALKLLKYYNSEEELKESSPIEISKVANISLEKAIKIKKFLSV